MKRHIYKSLLVICLFLTSCGDTVFERYPILTWEENKVDSILGLTGNTRGDSIGGFNSINGIVIDCNFDKTKIQAIIDLDSNDKIIDKESALIYRQAMCDLVHSTGAVLMSSSIEHGGLSLFKYKDGCEIIHCKDTAESLFRGDMYWKKALRKSELVGDSWYVNEKGTLFNQPG